MASGRPGSPDVHPHPRNDLTIPDMYGDGGLGGGARMLAPPRPPGPDDEIRPADSAGKQQERRRRQWGGDRRRARALPMIPGPVSDTRVAMARLAIIVTVCAWQARLQR
jgi:hypothetical protein